MSTKITYKDGRFTIIAPRENAGKSLPEISSGFEKEPGKITRVSSTTAQPLVAANFDATGAFIGGRTETDARVKLFLRKAAELGCKIEESIR